MIPRRNNRNTFRAAGFDPASIATSWLRLSHPSTTTSGEGFNSVHDVLGGAAAVQTTDNRRPVPGVSGNGLTIATYTADFLSWTLDNARNNQSPTWWCATWIRPTTVAAGSKAIWTASTGGVRLYGHQSGSTLSLRQFNDASNARIGTSASSQVIVNTWQFVAWLYDGTQATDATKARIALNANDLSLTFSANPNQVAMGTTLTQVAGNGLIGSINTSAGSPFVGAMGPNFWTGAALPTQAQLTALMLFEMPAD